MPFNRIKLWRLFVTLVISKLNEMRIIQPGLKTKWLGSVLLLLSMLTLTQCGGDDETPKVLNLGGTKTKLEAGKIYLTYSGEYSGYTYRDYIITDGTPTDMGSWSVDDYTDATFLIAFEVGTQSDALTAGTFQTMAYWNPVSVDEIAYLYCEIPADGDTFSYDTPEVDAGPTIKVKGKFNDGDKMTITVNGNLWDDQEQELISTKITFSGTIIDAR